MHMAVDAAGHGDQPFGVEQFAPGEAASKRDDATVSNSDVAVGNMSRTNDACARNDEVVGHPRALATGGNSAVLYIFGYGPSGCVPLTVVGEWIAIYGKIDNDAFSK